MPSLSLAMTFELVDGEVEVCADWLEEPVRAATFFDAYWLAVRARHAP